MPFSGYVAWKGGLTLVGVTLAGTLGCLVGSLVLYCVGLFGGRPLLVRYGKYVFVAAPFEPVVVDAVGSSDGAFVA
jgi:membrane protein DedA with SNARE-associated domain